jgi:hypothetical protein
MQTRLKLCLLLCAIASLSGCAGAAGAAVDAASQTLTCPKEQIVAQQATDPPPVEPPPEIAASPERNELWQRTRRSPKDHPVFVATGCGRTLRLVCAYQLHYLTDGTPSMQWDCMRIAEPPPRAVAVSVQTAGSSVPGTGLLAPAPAASDRASGPPVEQGGAETNVLAVLDALATQMDAQGNAAAAAEIRSKAQQFRRGKSPPAGDSGAPSATFSREPASGSPPLAR